MLAEKGYAERKRVTPGEKGYQVAMAKSLEIANSCCIDRLMPCRKGVL